MFSYLLPSQTCAVLQFTGNTIYHNHLDRMNDGTGFGQNVVPMENHIIVRQDTAYLYPSALHSTTLLNNLFYDINKKHQNIYRILDYGQLELRYSHWKSVQKNIFLHGQPPFKDNPKLNFEKCLLVLKAYVILVPITVKTTVTVFPSVAKLAIENPFFFDGSWNMHTPSWVTSQMYHVNCSSNQRHLFQSSRISVNHSCNFENIIAVEKFICVFCPDLGLYSKLTLFKLTLSFTSASVLKMNSLFGTLEMSNLWKTYCGNQTYVWFLDGIDTTASYRFYYANWTMPMVCAELIITYNLHSSFFKRNTTYDIEVQVATFQYAELHFGTHFLKLAHENSIQVIYKWHKQHLKGAHIRFRDIYKVVFAKNTILSWTDGWIQCNLLNMTLPTFSTKTQLQEVMSFISYRYRFQMVALFTGVLYLVSISSLD